LRSRIVSGPGRSCRKKRKRKKNQPKGPGRSNRKSPKRTPQGIEARPSRQWKQKRGRTEKRR